MGFPHARAFHFLAKALIPGEQWGIEGKYLTVCLNYWPGLRISFVDASRVPKS
jgi:hypothetical protein